ncbi:MAG: cell division protein FtsA [Chitinophagales bacterium]
MEKEKIIVGIDIGTTKICVIVGRINEFEKVEILALGKTDSLGVSRGVVANINKTVTAIERALDIAEAKLNDNEFEINEVYVGIAGQHISSRQNRGILTRKDTDSEISESDIGKLIDDMYRLMLDPGERIIHVLPQEFLVDNEPGIKDPIGMPGVRLEANFHIITGQVAAAKDIHRCVEKAGLKVKDLVLEPLASADAVLSDEEKEAGVALVDIGGGTTDIAIFQDNIIRHTAVIPAGGNIITQDIKEGLHILEKYAERLKVEYGSAIPLREMEQEVVTIPSLRNRPPKEISLYSLAQIIRERVIDIIDQVYYEINTSGYQKRLLGGIVLTGGGAQLRHLAQLVELRTGIDARIGCPSEHVNKSVVEDICHPMFATGVGLIIHGYNAEKDRKRKLEGVEVEHTAQAPQTTFTVKGSQTRNWWKTLTNKVKDFLEEDVDDFKS